MKPLSEREAKLILEKMGDGVLIENDGLIVYINDAYAQMLGYPSATEITGCNIEQVAHPEDYERLRHFGKCRALGQPAPNRYQFRAMGRYGKVLRLDGRISVARIDGKTLITTVVRESEEVEARAPFDVPGLTLLSPRELEVLRFVLAGKRSKQIALDLAISEKTVCTHRMRAFRKLGVQSDRELFRLATELGVLSSTADHPGKSPRDGAEVDEHDARHTAEATLRNRDEPRQQAGLDAR